MRKRKHRKQISYKKAKANFTRKAFGIASTSIMLLGINLFTFRGFMWAFIPIFFMGIGLIKEYGELKASKYEEEEFESRQFHHQKGGGVRIKTI